MSSQESLPQRVLVTGASGFIGSHCLEPLVRAGHEVFATYGKNPPVAVPGVKWVQSDLLQSGAAAALIGAVKPAGLLHLAWFVEPGKMITHEDNLRWVSASIELLREFKNAGGQRCLFGGSCYEYDWRYGYCAEDLTPLQPNTLYGAAKNGLAQAMLSYCDTVGLAGVWARMFFLYGERENPKRLVPSVVLSLLKGEPALSSHGLQIRDYMSAEDAGEGLVAAFRSQARGAYNIATGKAVTIRSIVEMLGHIVGRPDLVRIGALPARANDAPLVVADVAKATRDFGWSSRVDLEAGLRQTVDWWRQRL